MLLALVLAFAVQEAEPKVEWPDPQTAEQYYAALHELEVGSDPAAAARGFQNLANLYKDDPEHQDCLALAFAQHYRARLADGRAPDQSARDHILAMARDAGVEVWAQHILDLGEANRAEQDELDPSFAGLISDQLQTNNYGAISRYGRRAVPYLQPLVTRNVWQMLGPHQVEDRKQLQETSRRAAAAALPYSTEEYWAWVRDKTSDWSGAELSQIFDSAFHSNEPADEIAARAVDGFLVDLSRGKNLSHARWAVLAMCKQLARRRSQALEGRLKEIFLESGSVLAPVVIGMLPFNTREDRSNRYTELFLEAAHSPNLDVAEWARTMFQQYAEIGVLEQFAASGALIDRTRLALVLAGGLDGLAKEDSDRIVRRFKSAAGSIGNFQEFDPEIHELLLLNMLKDSDHDVRILAAKAAGRFKSFPAVTRAFQDKEPSVRHTALRFLRSQYPSHYPAGMDPFLLGMLTSEESREDAIRLLAKVGERLTHEQLLKIDAVLPEEHLMDNRVPYVLGAWSRQESGSKKLSAWVLEDRARIVSRAHAFGKLARLDPLATGIGFELLKDVADAERRQWIADQLVHWMSAAVSEAIDKGTLPQDVFERIQSLAQLPMSTNSLNGYFHQLGRLAHEEVPRTLELIRSITPNMERVRWLADRLNRVVFPGDSSVPRWRALLLADFMQRFPGQDYGSAKSWGREGSDHYAFILPTYLESGDDYYVGQALGSLSNHPEHLPQCEGLVRKYLKDPKHAAMAALVLTLVEVESELVDKLLAAWKMEGVHRRYSLLKAMGRTMDDRVVPILLEALADPNENVAKAAGMALDRIKRAREEQQSWEAWQITGGAGKSPVAALILKLKSDNQAVRVAAIESLGTLKAKEALPLLVDLLEDKNEAVATAAQKALQRINE